MSTPEAQARQQIDAQLIACGWVVQDYKQFNPAAGRGTCGLNFDIVPGDPSQSIMTCRVGSTDPEVHMPEIGSSLVHTQGLALLTQWITEMTPVACVPP